MSWGHDEYLFQILKPHLPLPALYMIRYHSFILNIEKMRMIFIK